MSSLFSQSLKKIDIYECNAKNYMHTLEINKGIFQCENIVDESVLEIILS